MGGSAAGDGNLSRSSIAWTLDNENPPAGFVVIRAETHNNRMRNLSGHVCNQPAGGSGSTCSKSNPMQTVFEKLRKGQQNDQNNPRAARRKACPGRFQESIARVRVRSLRGLFVHPTLAPNGAKTLGEQMPSTPSKINLTWSPAQASALAQDGQPRGLPLPFSSLVARRGTCGLFLRTIARQSRRRAGVRPRQPRPTDGCPTHRSRI